MRAIFLGTPEFALPALKRLIAINCEVLAVVTQPDRPSGRGRSVEVCPVKQLAVFRGLRVLQYENIRDQAAVDELTALKPDVMITAAYGQILSKKVLAIAPFGVINVHASLLPKHRGSAPINWAIIMGDAVGGVTTMHTARGVDTGEIIFRTETPIAPTETAGELTARLAEMGADVLERTLAAIEAGTAPRVTQDEDSMTYEPMLARDMGRLEFGMAAGDIVNIVRGLAPWPGAFTQIGGNIMKIWRVSACDMCGLAGEILAADGKNGLIIACGEGAVEVIEMQMPGKKRMSARDYLRGQAITTVERLNV